MRGSDNDKPRVVLASRKNAGIRVKLLWAADANTVAVLVRDDSTNEQFELLVEPDASPSTSTSTGERQPEPLESLPRRVDPVSPNPA
jgi:hypothetical protein